MAIGSTYILTTRKIKKKKTKVMRFTVQVTNIRLIDTNGASLKWLMKPNLELDSV